MIFNSLAFLVFAAVFFPVYFATRGQVRMTFLVLASYFFYGWWDWRFLFLLFFLGSLWSLIYSVFIVRKNWKKFKIEFSNSIKKLKTLVVILFILFICFNAESKPRTISSLSSAFFNSEPAPGPATR